MISYTIKNISGSIGQLAIDDIILNQGESAIIYFLTQDVKAAYDNKLISITQNGSGTAITDTDIITALGYTPYNATNPNGYTTNSGTLTDLSFVNSNGFTASILNSTTTPQITLSLQDATSTLSGKLNFNDWNTFNNKQSLLISGLNIKTINGNNILGSGDLVIAGGGGGSGDMLKSIYDIEDNGIVDAAESIIRIVYAQETILKGEPVYVSSTGNPTMVSRARADNLAKMPAVGIAQADISSGTLGKMIITGSLNNLNTSSYTLGQALYVGLTGGLTSTKPNSNSQSIGAVLRTGGSDGVIAIEPQAVLNLLSSDIPNLDWSKITTGLPTTLSGYEITNAQLLNSNLTSISNLSTVTTGLIKLINGVASLDSSTYLTSITSGNVTTALGYTPYNSTNPNGYTNNLGTVTNFSISNANGFSGNVVTNTTTPSLTITTTITGLLKGNGTSLLSAVAGTDYLLPNGSGASLTGITGSQVLGVELLINKDNSNGYVGLTLNKINFKNTASSFTSFLINSNTASRNYTFQDRNGTLADDTDLATKQSTLVSGTNIKTVGGVSILGSGDIPLGGTGTVTNFIFTNGNGFTGSVTLGTSTPTLSLTLQNASTSLTGQLTNTDWNTFNNKQSALVSSTNIKTIDGNSILGSGDLVILNKTITVSGDISGSGTNTLSLTLPNIVTANTFTKITYNAKGQITAGSNLLASDIPVLDWSKITTGKPTTLSGYGITDAQLLLVSGTNIKTIGGQSLLGSGDIAVGGSGTVTSFSIVNANGFSGSVATNTTTPALTITTTLTGLLKGNGTSLQIATAGTDYLLPNSDGSSLTGLLATQISGVEKLSNKDSSNGYVGLTLNKINFKNTANSFISFLINSNTAARNYTFRDRDGIIVDDTDLATKQNNLSGTGWVKSTAGAISYDNNVHALGIPSTDHTGIKLSDGTTLNFPTILGSPFFDFAGIDIVVPTDLSTLDDGVGLNQIRIAPTDGTAAVIPYASTTLTGVLTFTDWNIFNNKQATLVSGTNIKTVDGNSLLGSGNIVIANKTITISGDISGSGTSTLSLTLPNIVTAGTSSKVTYNAKGQITGTSSLLNSDITTALGFTPYDSTNPNGYTNNVGTLTNFIFTNANGFTGSLSLSTSTPTLSLNLQNATTSLSGQLTNTDWNTFNNKQSLLVSGTNIKTINGNNILGSGDLVIAGGSGSSNSVTATLSFGASFTDKAQTIVTGQTWVTTDSEIVPQVLTPSGVDPDEIYLLNFKLVISDKVAGVGFTITLYSESKAKGDYSVMCIGV